MTNIEKVRDWMDSKYIYNIFGVINPNTYPDSTINKQDLVKIIKKIDPNVELIN
jgi:hypothetical protein